MPMAWLWGHSPAIILSRQDRSGLVEGVLAVGGPSSQSPAKRCKALQMQMQMQMQMPPCCARRAARTATSARPCLLPGNPLVAHASAQPTCACLCRIPQEHGPTLEGCPAFIVDHLEVSAEVQDRYGGLFSDYKQGLAVMHEGFRLSHMLLYGVLLGLYIGEGRAGRALQELHGAPAAGPAGLGRSTAARWQCAEARVLRARLAPQP
jgi:hypothetical protein